MNDHATTYDCYHPDLDNSPITVTLEDGRVLAFVDYDFTHGHPGSRMDPPESDEVTVNEAWWVAPDGTEMPCTAEELESLHDGPEYDEILLACSELEGAKYYASMADDGGEL